MIEFTFRRSRGTWFVKRCFSGAFSSIGTENASETRLQTPKLDHGNAPIVVVVIVLIRLSRCPVQKFMAVGLGAQTCMKNLLSILCSQEKCCRKPVLSGAT